MEKICKIVVQKMHNSLTTKQNFQLISTFLHGLGFSSEAEKIYLALIQKGPQTLLQLSRNSQIERTKLYRLIESLIEKGLVEEVPAYKRKIIQATGLNTLELIVKERKRQDEQLLNSIPFLTEAVNTLSQKAADNNVIYYHGVEGIRTMTWHTLDCAGVFRTYSYRFWDDILGPNFVKKLNDEMLLRDFQVHDLYSDQYFDFKKWWYQTGHKHPSGNWDFWQSRYISEKIAKVDWNMDVYNDIVSYYYWQGEETFGFEIHNPRFALFQKQIHDVLWKMAKKMPAIDWTNKENWK